MIAENYFPVRETDDQVTGATSARQNRNLSSVVSSIRDDGPSIIDDPAVSCFEDHDEMSADTGTAATDRRVRALPDATVMKKVMTILMLMILVGAAALITAGRYPAADERGLHLAEIPAEIFDDIAAAGSVIQERLLQWRGQIGALFSGSSQAVADMPRAGSSDLAALERRQQQIIARLDSLSNAVATLESHLASERVERVADSVTQQAEQFLQLEAMEMQLSGLQQQVDMNRTVKQRAPVGKRPEKVAVKSPRTMPSQEKVADKPPAITPLPEKAAEKQAGMMPPQADWVVNVASSSQQAAIERLQRKLQGKDIHTELQQVKGSTGPRYRLRVTGFATGGEARRYAAELARNAGIEGAWASRR
jgi:cell division septation protein DedD